MRIDELELRQRARVVLEFLHLKQAEAVVRERRAGCAEREPKCESRVRRIGANCHAESFSSAVCTRCHYTVSGVRRAAERGSNLASRGACEFSMHVPHGGEKHGYFKIGPYCRSLTPRRSGCASSG